MDDLLKSYKQTLRDVNKARLKANETDKQILSNVTVSLKYCISWLETGYEPTATDISRYSYRRREIPMDPAWIVRYRAAQIRPKDAPKELRDLVDDLLATLTPKEKDALILVRGAGYSFSDAAQVMGYKSKGSVERLVSSAEEKLRATVKKPPKGSNEFYLLKPVQMILAL